MLWYTVVVDLWGNDLHLGGRLVAGFHLTTGGD